MSDLVVRVGEMKINNAKVDMFQSMLNPSLKTIHSCCFKCNICFMF